MRICEGCKKEIKEGEMVRFLKTQNGDGAPMRRFWHSNCYPSKMTKVGNA